MSFAPGIVPAIWLWVFLPVYLACLGLAVSHARWRQLKVAADANVFFGACVALWLLWQMRATVDIWPGLEFHLLLLTAATLMFGWAFAFIAASVAQAGLVLQGLDSAAGFPMAVTLNAGTAVLTTYLVHRAAREHLPRHFFVYVFVSCVLGGALAMLASRLAGMAMLVVCGAYSPETLVRGDFLLLLPLMMFPEAFVNGGLMTLLVAYRPEWVSSFLDRHYLKGK